MTLIQSGLCPYGRAVRDYVAYVSGVACEQTDDEHLVGWLCQLYDILDVMRRCPPSFEAVWEMLNVGNEPGDSPADGPLRAKLTELNGRVLSELQAEERAQPRLYAMLRRLISR